MFISGERMMCPDWRFARAREYVDMLPDIKFGKDEDFLVRDLTSYIVDTNPERKMTSRQLAEKHGIIHNAAMLRLESFEGSIRYTMEALVLCNTPPTDIATICGADEKLVTTYLGCYFDLSDDARRASYINRLHIYLKAYAHPVMCDLGYKFISAFGGRERFMRLIVDRTQATNEDLEWLNLDTIRLRTMHIWSRTWEQLNDQGDKGEDTINLYNAMISAQKSDRDSRAGVVNTENLDAVEQSKPHIHWTVLTALDKVSEKEERRLT